MHADLCIKSNHFVSLQRNLVTRHFGGDEAVAFLPKRVSHNIVKTVSLIQNLQGNFNREICCILQHPEKNFLVRHINCMGSKAVESSA